MVVRKSWIYMAEIFKAECIKHWLSRNVVMIYFKHMNFLCQMAPRVSEKNLQTKANMLLKDALGA